MSDLSKQAMAVAGGLLLAIGSIMTWISVDLGFQSFSTVGTATIEGKLTLTAGLILIAAGALAIRGVGPLTALNWLLGAAAVFGAVVLIAEYVDVQNRIAAADGSGASATIGGGVWIAALGAALAVGATAWLLITDRPLVSHVNV